MDVIYNNFWLNLLLTIVYAGLALNFGTAALMLVTDPVAIETDIVDSNISFGNLIITPNIYDYESMRYSYQVYMQKAVLPPALYNFINTFEYFIYSDIANTSLNKEAESHKNDGLCVEVLRLNDFKKVIIEQMPWILYQLLNIL